MRSLLRSSKIITIKVGYDNAMGLRLYTQLPNLDDSKVIRIEVHDSEYDGVAIEIDTEGGGVTYNPDAQGVLERPGIVTMSAMVIMHVYMDSQAMLDFVDDVGLSDEGRFMMRVTVDGALEFVGIILAEQTEIEETTPLARYEIGAVDGLTLMKKKSYGEAQGQAYIDQNADGKYHVNATVLHGVMLDLNGQGSRRDLWATVDQNVGDHFDVATGKFSRPGTYDFVAFLSVQGHHDDYLVRNSGPVVGKLIKIDPNDAETVLSEISVEFDQPNGQRRDMNLAASKVVLIEGEAIVVELSWDLRTKTSIAVQPRSFFENKLDLTASVKNVYASFFTHMQNLMQALPIYQYYDDVQEFWSVLVDFQEDNQGAVRGEHYNGIPYNAFVENLGVSPPKVMSVYESLEAMAKMIGGVLRYRQGRYQFHPYHNITKRHAYNRLGGYIGEIDQPVQAATVCIGKTNRGNLPALGQVELAYDRVGTKNLLSGIESQLSQANPGFVYKKYVELDSEVLYLTIAVRLLGEATGSANYNAIYPPGKVSGHRHVFEASLKFDEYVHIYDESPSGPLLSIIYNDPALTVSDQKITLYAQAMQPTDIVHEMVLTFTLPAITFTGDLEFSFKYLHTLLPGGTLEEVYNYSLPDPLNYEIIGIKLRRFSDEDIDKLYSERIIASLENDNNSKDQSDVLVASDLWEVENDPGAMRVYDGAEWVRPGLYAGDSYHMTLAKWMAAKQARPVRLHKGAFRLHDPQSYDVVYDGKLYYFLEGRYNRVMGELSGQWVEHMADPIGDRMTANIYTDEAGQTRTTQSVNNLSKAPVSQDTGADGGAVLKQYELYVDGITTDYIDVPVDRILPDPAIYDEVALMRVFSGSMRNASNYIYRDSMSHATHFKMDYENRRFLLGRVARATDKHFFMWQFLVS